ncbi:MAG: DUF4399 domain-containing protein [Candidatus Nitrotoga sp.]|nr:DUF4399 domain-containing protein [Candidatus Nitrotoga sp.]MDO9446861.1 DUF4399 domain-containing protein [Candidatus Nitrotoga sp.]MDP1855805.1 DUF4399 domain-containing protein [Candidatus Nitrotoga sp.]MDP3498342.1 DUF4399 domain-containing protein [Candidatus Nitrotoga sp.]
MRSKLALPMFMLLSSIGYAHNVLANDYYSIKSPGQRVYFVEPKDGAIVGNEVKVVMGVEGMEIKPAGAVVDNTGHHHLLIDVQQQLNAGEAVPVGNDQYRHFGKGQTETMIKLAPGTHTLTLQFANGAHVSYGEKMRSTINVTVK